MVATLDTCQPRQPLLSSQVPFIFILAISIAMILSYAAHFVFSNTVHAFCTPRKLPQWIESVSYMCAAIFTANIALQCIFSVHIWLSKPRIRATLDMRLMILVIHLIAVSSQYATYFGWFGSIQCIDGFGYYDTFFTFLLFDGAYFSSSATQCAFASRTMARMDGYSASSCFLSHEYGSKDFLVLFGDCFCRRDSIDDS